jgi:hypothetical protein
MLKHEGTSTASLPLFLWYTPFMHTLMVRWNFSGYASGVWAARLVRGLLACVVLALIALPLKSGDLVMHTRTCIEGHRHTTPSSDRACFNPSLHQDTAAPLHAAAHIHCDAHCIAGSLLSHGLLLGGLLLAARLRKRSPGARLQVRPPPLFPPPQLG